MDTMRAAAEQQAAERAQREGLCCFIYEAHERRLGDGEPKRYWYVRTKREGRPDGATLDAVVAPKWTPATSVGDAARFVRAARASKRAFENANTHGGDDPALVEREGLRELEQAAIAESIAAAWGITATWPGLMPYLEAPDGAYEIATGDEQRVARFFEGHKS
jgi:hypothetical protein